MFLIQGLKQDEIVAVNVRPCPKWLYIAFGTMFAGVRRFQNTRF